MNTTRRRGPDVATRATEHVPVIGGNRFGRAFVAGISDPGSDPAFEGTGVDGIDVPRLLVDRIRV